MDVAADNRHGETTNAEERLKVFIFYSRKDAAFVDELEEFLSDEGFEPLVDRHKIAEFEQWWPRIMELIGQSDTVIFALSPDAIASNECEREVAFAEILNKRIAPVVICSLEDARAPEDLSKFNYVFLDGSPARCIDTSLCGES